MNHDNVDQLKSPCIRQCCLDEKDICLGCGRSLDEIIAWHTATAEQKAQILLACENRRKDRAR